MEGYIFLAQIVTTSLIGGMVGEFYRSSQVVEVFADVNLFPFIASILASSFLAVVLGYLVYIATEHRWVALLVVAGASYQDEKYISRIVRNTVSLIAGKIAEGIKVDEDWMNKTEKKEKELEDKYNKEEEYDEEGGYK